MTKADYVVIGGGLFGVYTAIHLAKKSASIILIEKEKELFRKASVVNQARIHSGYHYPRSIATAKMSDDNKARFTKDHEAFINSTYEKYYGIDKFASLTDGQRFEQFCDYINIPFERVKEHNLFNFNRLEALYRTTEYTFDPYLIAAFYKNELKRYNNVKILPFTKIEEAEQSGNTWHISVKNLGSLQQKSIVTNSVINATYAASNSINRLFGQQEIDLQHEIAEIAFVSSQALKNIGLTVMDGQFGSIMPYGKSGLHSLSSVAYTHHKVSYKNEAHFSCQKENVNCQTQFLADCNTCTAQPLTAYKKMTAQMKLYFSGRVDWNYYFSKFTIKSKLKANYIDDGRPTEITQFRAKPDFYCIFAGKINSIYEVEKIL